MVRNIIFDLFCDVHNLISVTITKGKCYEHEILTIFLAKLKKSATLSVAEQWRTVILPTNLRYCPWRFVGIYLHTLWKSTLAARR